MATEVTSIGVGMETDGVERGIRTLQQLANQGPRVEKSMQGIEAAASKVDNSLKGFGDGADKGLKALTVVAPGAEQGLKRVGRSAEETKRYIDNLHRSITGMGTIQTAPVARSFDSVKTSALDASKAVDLLKSTLAVTGIGIGVKEVINLADGYTKFTAQLKLASKSADDYAASMTAVRRISLDAQQGLSETGTLYARIANGTAELGLSQQKLSDITETVALGLKVSGATASESASAMLQLSQAFASGVLRGEEFNAVNESAPRLMKALADGIGVPVGALRELASEGKITSQVMADALPKALESIRKEAEQIQTIGGSFTVLKNNLLEFVGAGDKASGATKAISASVTGLANNLDTIAVAAGGLALILAGRYVGAMTAASASTVAMAASTARANVAAVALAASISPAAAAVSAFGIAARGASTAVLGLFGGPWGLAITAIGAATAAFLYFRDTTEETIKSIGGLNQPLEDLKKKLDDLPPEKRVSVIIDIEKSGREAIKQADRDIEALVQSVAGAANIKMPLDEFEKLTDSIRDTAKSGGDLTPILQKAAQSGGIPQSVLQSWLNLAANIREAHNAAGNAAGAIGSTMSGAGGDVADVFIGPTDTALRKEAEAVLKTTAAYKSRAEQMAEVSKQADVLKASIDKLKAAGLDKSDEVKGLQSRLDGVNERLASMAKSGRSAAGGAKQVENAYTSLSKRVGDYIEQLRIEATQSDKVSTAQKLQIQLDDLLVKSKGKVTAAKVASLKADIQTARAMEEEAKAVKRTVEAYQDYIRDQEAIARADVELSKAKEALWKSIAEQNIELENQSRMLELEASNIGKSAYERTLANEVLKAQIELEKELRAISNNQTLDAGAKDEAEAAARARAVKKIALAERKAYVTEWEKTSQTIGDTLADYIMGGGKDAAQYLKRLFSTLVLQPIVQTAVGSIFGGAGGAQAMLGGGNGGVLGTASNLNSLYGAFSGGITSSIGGAIGSLGSMFGSSALTSFAAGMKGSTLAAGLAGPTTAGASGAMGLGASVGAALPWVAGGLAIASLFGGDLMGSLFGRKLKDSGIEGTFGGSQGFTGNTYEFYKGGAFRSNKTKRSPLDEVTRSQFADQFTGAQSSIKTMGDTLGLITDAVDGATYSIKLSLKGLSEADASKAIQAEFDRIAESMAGLVLVTNEYSIADENRIETLTRLSGSLTAFNGSLELLGLSAYDASLKSADAAYKIINAFGGLENYGQAIQGYYQSFYSEAERMDMLQKQLLDALSGLDLSIDPTMGDSAKEQFRAAFEAAIASGQSELASQLLAMSGSFATAADAAQKSMKELADAAAEAAAAAAELAQNLRSSLISIEAQFTGGGFSRQYQAEGAASQLQSLLSGAGISKDAGTLTQTLLSATTDEVESYFREIWNVLDTDEARLHLVNVTGAMLDLAAASDAAAQAAADAAAAIAAERSGLEQRWLQAIGDTAELRRRELDALDPSNRALLEMIYGLEDAQKSMSDLANASQQAAQKAAAAWQNWGTAAGLGATYLGDTSGLQMRRSILNAQIRSSQDPADRLGKLQELIGIEQAIAQAQQKSRAAEVDAIKIRQQALQAEISSAKELLSAAKSLGDYAKSLQYSEASGLSDIDRLSALGGQYSSLMAKARGGDSNAINQLQGVSSDYLGLSKTLAVSGSDYAVQAGRMAAELEAMAKAQELTAQSQVTGYEAQIAKLTQQAELLSAQVELSDSTKGLIAKSMIDQAEIWDRENTQALTLQELQSRAADSLSVMPENVAKALRSTLNSNASYIASSVGGAVSGAIGSLAKMLGLDGSHATGLSYVPFDGYRAELHKGERVLTAQQNQAYSSGLPFVAPVRSAENKELIEEVRALRQQNALLVEMMDAIKQNTGQFAEQFDNVTAGGNAMATEVMG